jgi:hypothetical protein
MLLILLGFIEGKNTNYQNYLFPMGQPKIEDCGGGGGKAGASTLIQSLAPKLSPASSSATETKLDALEIEARVQGIEPS